MSGADNILHGDSAADYLMPQISLRDYFAGQCISVFAKQANESSHPALDLEWATQASYEVADAMLAERAKAIS